MYIFHWRKQKYDLVHLMSASSRAPQTEAPLHEAGSQELLLASRRLGPGQGTSPFEGSLSSASGLSQGDKHRLPHAIISPCLTPDGAAGLGRFFHFVIQNI